MLSPYVAELRSSRRFFPNFLSRTFSLLSLLVAFGIFAVGAHGTAIYVPAGTDLQAALDAAQAGDEIVLEAGAIYRGAFTLRRKAGGDAWITIRSSRLAELAAERRVMPVDAALMPKLEAAGGNAPVFQTEDGAHHYRLLGLEVRPEPGGATTALISLGRDSQTELSQVPHHIQIDRCYIHAHPGLPTRRGIALNSAHTDITN